MKGMGGKRLFGYVVHDGAVFLGLGTPYGLSFGWDLGGFSEGRWMGGGEGVRGMAGGGVPEVRGFGLCQAFGSR